MKSSTVNHKKHEKIATWKYHSTSLYTKVRGILLRGVSFSVIVIHLEKLKSKQQMFQPKTQSNTSICYLFPVSLKKKEKKVDSNSTILLISDMIKTCKELKLPFRGGVVCFTIESH